MKSKKSYLIKILLVAFLLFASSCSDAGTANASFSKIILVGSTPGDSPVKSMLSINPEKQIDFIRWDLTLNHSENDSKTFVLNINFGEAQPNTLGFKGGGETLFWEGIYTVSENIYELKNEKTSARISLVKLNENLFHLLMPDGKLMVGNGGWSYTLNRKDSPEPSSEVLPSRTDSLPEDATPKIVFDGRTPCSDFAKHYNLQAGNDCLKLKWRLILSRDSKTKEPTAYTLQTTLNRPVITEGKWAIVKGAKTGPEAIIYRLDPDKPEKSISFLVGDEKVLFFLDRENRLLTGNGDFSFTLNRRKQ